MKKAKSLAASYGAVALLDKMSLYTELLPAILQLVAQPSANPSASRLVQKLEGKDCPLGLSRITVSAAAFFRSATSHPCMVSFRVAP